MPEFPQSFTDRINPMRITLARRRRGMTKTDLAKAVGITVQTIMSYERGASVPLHETFTAIQQVLGFPPEFFTGTDIDEPDVQAVSFRSLRSMTAKLRDMAITQGAIATMVNRWIEERFELPRCALPVLSRYSDRPEEAAAVVRREFGLGELSVRNMVHLLEANGVRVFSLSIQAKEVDAFSFWNGENAYVLLNTYKSAEHSRFDAAHELAHLVLHKHSGPSGVDAEVQANRFASAFLMPYDSVKAKAPRFPTVDGLIRLKAEWGVSLASLAYRLHQTGCITDWQYRTLFTQIAKRGYRVNEPNEMPRESSQMLPKLFAFLYTEERMSRSAIAAQLAIPAQELDSLLFGLAMTAVGGTQKQKAPKLGAATNLLRVK